MAKSVREAAHCLTDVLERENAALRAMDLPAAASLLREKTNAIADFATFAEASPRPTDPALIPLARRLDALALENRRLLERALAAQKRVIGIVVRAAAAAAAEPGYGARGRRARLAAMAFSARA